MVIYIYGSDSFKKDIHEVLNHSNIKFRLDAHGEIVDLNTLDDLKNAIEDNPSNIYLIDDAKIIKKNALNQKIKFLQPKDGIEQEYLLDHGIGDLSVDSIEELSKHIVRKLDSSIPQDNIQDSIVEIVEDAYEKDDENSYVQLDDELSALLSSSKSKDSSDDMEDILNEIESIDEIEVPLIEELEDLKDDEEIEALDELKDFPLEDESLVKLEDVDNFPSALNEEMSELKDLSFDEDFDNIETIETNNINLEGNVSQGDSMADEFSEFDTLSESDILAALDELENVTVSKELKQTTPSAAPASAISSNESLNISSSSSDDIAKLISQLLNNKTLEITIKVKD